MKRKHKRLILIITLLSLLATAIGLMLYQLNDSLVFFYSPTELHAKQQSLPPTKTIRIGGLVKEGSVSIQGDQVRFTLTDTHKEAHIYYQGIVPQLFREGQGMVASGLWDKQTQQFNATTLLAKHDENYMPREVMEALKAQGQWKGEK